MAFVEDFTPFLSNAEFAVPCTLPGGAVVQVIFDDAHQAALTNSFEASAPTALGTTAELSALQHGSALQINGRAWSVEGIQPDGTGITRLILERTA